MITLSVNGAPYTSFKDITVEKSISDLTGEFSFTAVRSAGIPFPFKAGDQVDIRVNSYLIISGYIDIIQVSYDSMSHDIVMRGRDITEDIVDSTIGGDFDFSTPILLEDVIKQTLKKVGITNINVDSRVPNLPPFNFNIVTEKTGTSIFEFIENYARQQGVLITTDNVGTLILTRAGDSQVESTLINQINGTVNNIISGNFTIDYSKRFNKYTFYAQSNLSSNNDVTSDDSSNIFNFAIDSDIRTTRTFTKIAENSSTNSELKTRAQWEANVRVAKSFVYQAVVLGDSIIENGKPWEVNTLIRVYDDFADIDETLLIDRITFNVNIDRGTTTTLSLVNKDAYTVLIQTPKTKNQYANVTWDQTAADNASKVSGKKP